MLARYTSRSSFANLVVLVGVAALMLARPVGNSRGRKTRAWRSILRQGKTDLLSAGTWYLFLTELGRPAADTGLLV